MKKYIKISLVLLTLIGIIGCESFYKVFPGWKEDPFAQSINLVNTGMAVADSEWYIPECVDKPELERKAFCATWKDRVVPSVELAKKRAQEAYELANSGGDARTIAMGAIDQAIAALNEITLLAKDDKVTEVCRHIRTALVVVKSQMELQTITKEN